MEKERRLGDWFDFGCVKLLSGWPLPRMILKGQEKRGGKLFFILHSIMSFRLILARNLLRQNITSTIHRPARLSYQTICRSPLRKSQQRFYSVENSKQSFSKISNMVSAPDIIQAAKLESVKKAEPKVSKLKELSKKYGAVGILVYLGVGFVDLGVTLGIIQFAGLEKVKALEEGALDIIRSTGEKIGFVKTKAIESSAEPSNKDEDPSFASVFILAYGIHKTLLLPVRLGITAAITPAVVRKMHQLGWARYFPRLLGASTPK